METKAEQDFMEQVSRTFLVEWCSQTLIDGSIQDVAAGQVTEAMQQMASRCLLYAQDKGWVGKSSPPRILAKGYATAATFLKR